MATVSFLTCPPSDSLHDTYNMLYMMGADMQVAKNGKTKRKATGPEATISPTPGAAIVVIWTDVTQSSSSGPKHSA